MLSCFRPEERFLPSATSAPSRGTVYNLLLLAARGTDSGAPSWLSGALPCLSGAPPCLSAAPLCLPARPSGSTPSALTGWILASLHRPRAGQGECGRKRAGVEVPQ